jgi:hypothetical protein
VSAPTPSKPNVVPITRDNAVDYLAAAALNVITNQAPGLDHPDYEAARQSHDLAVSFLRDALKKLGKTAI